MSPDRVATVLVAEGGDPVDRARLAAALLSGSPRVAPAGPGACRADARGWDRRGGEDALVRALRRGTAEAGFTETWVGVGDVAIVADSAALLARELEGRGEDALSFPGVIAGGEGAILVAPGAGRMFLAPLPLSYLPIPEEVRETLRALGFRRIGELAMRERSELETRFGPAGLLAHRWARGEDDRAFRPFEVDDLPEVSLELEGSAVTLEPLLFVLRHLLHRVCTDLLNVGRCASRLSLELHLDVPRGPVVRRASVLPARPTRREDLLYDLCRASLERAVEKNGHLSAPVCEIALRVEETAAPGARQGDLFAGDWRDAMAAAAALSRLRARLGEEAVAWPRPRAIHKPESRSRWRPAASVETPEEQRVRSAPSPGTAGLVSGEGAFESALHLLPEPVEVDVRTEDGLLTEIHEAGEVHPLIVTEGPERISGDWWKEPYQREYYRACTGDGELLWLFREREVRGRGEVRWWLQGVYD